MRFIQLLFCFLCICSAIQAQNNSTFPVNGVDDVKDGLYAFTNATIYIDYQTKLLHATLLIKNGEVIQTGVNISIPNEAIIIDLEGKFIYPSFIDLYSNYGMPSQSSKRQDDAPQMLSNKKGAYGWNEAIKPEVQASELFVKDATKAEEYRKYGFGAVLSHVTDGISRGTGALVNLGNQRENKLIIQPYAANFLSFNKGTSTQDYPSSLMGAIALLRQTYLDAVWYRTNKENKEYNISLDYWNRNASLPQIFDAPGKLNILRANSIATENVQNFIYKSSVGDEYQLIDQIKQTKSPCIISLNFPKPYDVEDPIDALNVSLEDMLFWEAAPSNPAALEKEAIPFALTLDGMEKKEDFLGNLRKAVEYGLSEETALKALTYNPALFIKMHDKIGSLEKGKLANFIITSTSLFNKDCIIYQNWVQGIRYIVTPNDFKDIRGTYDITMNGTKANLYVSGSAEKPELQLVFFDSTKAKIDFIRNGSLLSLSFFTTKDSMRDYITMSGSGDVDMKQWSGYYQNKTGARYSWSASKVNTMPAKEETPLEKKNIDIPAACYPYVSYGNIKIPEQENILFKNATVWTNEKEGIVTGCDVLILNGKIIAVGKNLNAMGAKVYDASGKHITCGIIDEHSHICISGGVNEGTQSSSAEVRIGDVINSEDINMYRQLSGGVVAAQLLHGSANPIGGQSALIKFRWGYTPEQLKIASADGFIKFALGENVKQSNWGDRNTVRFPQTRMGVEQTYCNYFTKAKEYEMMKRMKISNPSVSYRKDLELECLAEILNKKRFITCHSYVQSEINMLMHVADSFGFTVNTFTHILEGYKVADKMKAHGVNASTFADWWAYKYEVIDAIPHNAGILQKVGVNTCINSDDAEMGRRLNQEAAKSVKYTKMSEEEAWKLVTLNAAKALHLDKFMGSIKAGKDADIVIWNTNPLSIYATPTQTYVDGICFYSAEMDAEMRKRIEAERARLIQKMLDAKKGGSTTQKVTKKVLERNGCMGHESNDHSE